ncbi:hypothetical protein DS745_20590 [Anaerobacillus alkaliphilus]|uniref:Lipoprotein n=1 Tax=Anaerobacillus alkaliphilus TaxID=1548597 RepID=A0A4Q0VM60_9BACI|nr:hypothetical protein [Anaerobacillus alkaliphilus]RXI96144.1 hypothetical protein DS745_20590 [Anaerobacillus alkaliphilus]
MKKLMLGLILLLVTFLIAGCTGDDGLQLTRVDVQTVNTEGFEGEVVMITDQALLKEMKDVFKHVKWEPNSEVSMPTRENYKVTLYFQEKDDMPERQYEYRVWFNADDTVTIISSNLREGYGLLDTKNTELLKQKLTSEK